MSDQPAHTPGPWEYVPSNENHGPFVTGPHGGDIADCYTMSNLNDWSVCNGGTSKPVPFQHEKADANAHLISAAPDMACAVRASHAWAYCEHHGLGDFSARSVLCAHAEYLNAKALAKIEGRDFDKEYKGAKRMIVWPYVSLEESSETEAEALVQEAIEHERAAIAKATGAQ